jgi:hypothetical protein
VEESGGGVREAIRNSAEHVAKSGKRGKRR